MEKFKAHILVVDDDDGIRELVKEYLSQNNYLVTSSNSAEDALEKVKVINMIFFLFINLYLEYLSDESYHEYS